ncbi:hypothetical protein EI94DRAFT_609418 [Lactarius quietus]|nr:hypothetical protein EI94DRAFT_609418 [Lactarius quietus]
MRHSDGYSHVCSRTLQHAWRHNGRRPSFLFSRSCSLTQESPEIELDSEGLFSIQVNCSSADFRL